MTTLATPPTDRSQDPIGVFDSGVGGLSVLRALRTELPDERFIYVADAGHAPYGERDDSHVMARSMAVARHLVAEQRIKALVVACNTATAAAIRKLRQAWPELPIIGIEPALKPAVAQSQTRHIGVLATRGTLGSEKFRTLLQTLEPQARFVLQACDGLADAIERDDLGRTQALCATFTQALGSFGTQAGGLDTLVLGCTHYPFAADVLRSLVGPGVAFLEGGAPVARQTRRLLAERSWLSPVGANGDNASVAMALRFFTTGTPQALQSAAQRWLQWQVDVQSLPHI